MSFVAAIGPIVKDNRPLTVPAVKCMSCKTVQTKYVNRNMARRRKCKGCGWPVAIFMVGYELPA